MTKYEEDQQFIKEAEKFDTSLYRDVERAQRGIINWRKVYVQYTIRLGFIKKTAERQKQEEEERNKNYK